MQGPLAKTQRPARVVELPVSATEDRLVGTLDLEHALKYGERVFEPGLLATANRAILYVDEVNLLDDHLVDTLLDAAAMGVNTVEREGVSFSHPARFILVGTMNPEGGRAAAAAPRPFRAVRRRQERARARCSSRDRSPSARLRRRPAERSRAPGPRASMRFRRLIKERAASPPEYRHLR